jgi:hypothetical protein
MGASTATAWSSTCTGARFARTGTTTRAAEPAARTRRWANTCTLSASPRRSRRRRALFIASRRTFIRSHVYQTVIFGRLPRFRKWVESQGYAPELLDKATKRRLLDIYVNTLHDPYQVFYEGMNFMAEYGVVDYLEGDDESLNCALKLVWRNPYYKPLMLNRAVAEIVEPVPAVR